MPGLSATPALHVVQASIALILGFNLLFAQLQAVESQRRNCNPGACEIALTRAASVSDQGHRGILPDYSIFATQDRSGRFAVASRALDRIVVFDSKGKILKLISQNREGIDNFRRVTSLLAAKDGTLLAYDGVLRRLTTIGDNLEIVSTVPFRFRPSFRLDNGRFVIAQQIGTNQLIGEPIHVADANGEIVRSFGAQGASFRADRPLFSERVVAQGSDGTVWAVPPGRYVIERWNPENGTKLAEVAVSSNWFKASDRLNSDERSRPTAVIEALWEKAGFVWVLLRDADGNWQAPARANIERPLDIDEYDRTFDSVLEVIDIGSGKIVASKRFPNALWGRSPSDLFVSRRTRGSSGPVHLDVWRAELKSK